MKLILFLILTLSCRPPLPPHKNNRSETSQDAPASKGATVSVVDVISDPLANLLQKSKTPQEAEAFFWKHASSALQLAAPSPTTDISATTLPTETAQPTATPTPSLATTTTPTPTVTNTPTPTKTPTVTNTLTPTNTLVASNSPSPEPTPTEEVDQCGECPCDHSVPRTHSNKLALAADCTTNVTFTRTLFNPDHSEVTPASFKEITLRTLSQTYDLKNNASADIALPNPNQVLGGAINAGFGPITTPSMLASVYAELENPANNPLELTNAILSQNCSILFSTVQKTALFVIFFITPTCKELRIDVKKKAGIGVLTADADICVLVKGHDGETLAVTTSLPSGSVGVHYFAITGRNGGIFYDKLIRLTRLVPLEIQEDRLYDLKFEITNTPGGAPSGPSRFLKLGPGEKEYVYLDATLEDKHRFTFEECRAGAVEPPPEPPAECDFIRISKYPGISALLIQAAVDGQTGATSQFYISAPSCQLLAHRNRQNHLFQGMPIPDVNPPTKNFFRSMFAASGVRPFKQNNKCSWQIASTTVPSYFIPTDGWMISSRQPWSRPDIPQGLGMTWNDACASRL